MAISAARPDIPAPWDPRSALPHTVSPSSSFHHALLFVTPELAGLAKTGGLGNVALALPRALAQRHDVRILMPAYSEVLCCGRRIHILGQLPGKADIPSCELGLTTLEGGLSVYLLMCPQLYQRSGGIYTDDQGRDWYDNHLRFGRLCLAAAQIAAGIDWLAWQPDILHLNDWTTGLTPSFLHDMGLTTPTVMTIHNLGYQGWFHAASGASLGLMDDEEHYRTLLHERHLCFLKAGIQYADQLTTVSDTYADEIIRPGTGCGLENLLADAWRRGRLTGITNGIDDDWDPSSDPHLAARFDIGQWHGKARNAAAITDRFGLEDDGPLFAVISRLAEQKGLDLTEAVASEIVARGGRLAIMGRGDPVLEQRMASLGRRYPGRIGVHIGFDETDARRLFAGSDFLLMPSRYEPCGLSQMYAQRYGSLPIARRTGGLVDTIEDDVTGFLFGDASPRAFLAAIERALQVYACAGRLHQMRNAAMRAPRHWKSAASPYHALYARLITPALPLRQAGRQVQAS